MLDVSLIRKGVLRMVMKIAKRVVAGLTAFVCLFWGIVAYADSFNPIYSGKLSYNDKMYMYITENDAQMHMISYLDSASLRFLTISNADSVIFTNSKLVVTYPKNAGGVFCYSDGSTYKKVDGEIMIETYDVSASFFLTWVTSITVTYNNRAYSS